MPDKTQVAAMDPSLRNSSKMVPDDEDSTLVMEPGANACYWNGAEFSEGSLVESQGVTYECSFGRWVQND